MDKAGENKREQAKRRLRSPVTFVIVAVVALGAWFLFSSQLDTRDKLFTHDKEGYALRYASTWTAKEATEKDSTNLGISAVFERRQIKAKVIIKSQRLNKRETLKQASVQLDRVLKVELPGFRKLSANLVKMAGGPSLRYTYSFTDATGKQVLQDQVIFINGKRAYYLVLQTNPGDHKKVSDEFFRMANTFELD